MFGIGTNIRNKQITPCTPEQLDSSLRSSEVNKACAAIADALEQCRRGEISRDEFEELKAQYKRRLPILTPHAIFVHGQRKSELAIPSGLSMYDIDHMADPRNRWAEIASKAEELGICLAHVTPSTEGLRLIFVMPQGMTLEQAQLWMSQQLGDATYDAVCKDYARCSFLVPEDYVLYRNDSLLFADVETIRLKSIALLQPKSQGADPASLAAPAAPADPATSAMATSAAPESVQASASTAVPSTSAAVTPSAAVPANSAAVIPSAAVPSTSAAVTPSAAVPTSSAAVTPSAAVPTSSPAVTPSAAVPTSSAAVTPSAAVPSNSAASPLSYSPTYKGIPYAQIVEKLEEQLGGKPEQGARNSFLFSMACALRYICNNDERWLQQLLPRYGQQESEWKGTIHSAVMRPLSRSMEGILVRALKVCGVESNLLATNAQESANETAESKALTPPPMPKKLPPLIELLVSQTPDIYKPAVAHAVFPSLAAHLYRTTFRYIDNVEHEATLMCLLMAGTGAGKSCVDEPINRIMADIRKRDEENLRREREWKDEMNRKGANKDKRERPKGLVIQEIDADITNPAFVMRTAEAEGHFLYSKLNEIDQFDALKGSGKGGQQFQLMCLSFDPNNRYGQTRVGAQSVTEKVTVRYNWNASTTIAKGQSYFRNVLINGPISRINFCTIPEREIGAPMPVYGTYTEAFDQQLKPYIERLCGIRGLVACPEAEALAVKLNEESNSIAVQTQNRTYENLSFRANVIAYLKAMVLYVAHGGWEESFNDFIRWSKEYDLYCKMAFFGDLIEETEATSNKTNRRGPANLLTFLPSEFTKDELAKLLIDKGKRSPVCKILNTWEARGYVKRLNGQTRVYKKIS